MEESRCQKLIFDFRPATEMEMTRKRSSSQLNEDASECSKKIRKQLQDFDLSSDTSSMDTDNDEVESVATSSVGDVTQDELAPSTSTDSQVNVAQSPNITIISVDVIQPANAVESPDDVQLIEEAASVPEVSTTEQVTSQQSSQPSTSKKSTEKSNRIVIDDSDDEDESANSNRRHSAGPSASSYSFTNVNGEGFESRSSFHGGRHHHHSRRFRCNSDRRNSRDRFFDEQSRNFQRSHAENMERIQEQVRLAREHAARAVRASTSAIPDLVSTFQDHFRRPLFRVADLNQQIFGNFYRR